ncbi:hypothetical protein E2R51_15555 [Jeotgalibacillus sp. S-D1]|uniref:hypothetical protein n=1 Tax=Jeotgalibacillus sp. S-D1 TaxID=2552189 RepID=UPI00105A048D|nr:hypothetical protein [Jeotgalibacillus sp. S-D1]TDL31199.1 hypothetical protein E2R51_15555 [Jeotgalibacillus sp. S-D1]
MKKKIPSFDDVASDAGNRPSFVDRVKEHTEQREAEKKLSEVKVDGLQKNKLDLITLKDQLSSTLTNSFIDKVIVHSSDGIPITPEWIQKQLENLIDIKETVRKRLNKDQD